MASDSTLRRAILALDSGGSKCEALLVRDDGTALAAARAQRAGISGRSPQIVGEAARAALNTHPIHELHLAAFEFFDPNELGVESGDPPKRHVLSEADGLFALADEDHGVAVIAGTGARAFGVNRAGRYLALDGLGPYLGDSGGGYQVGVQALRAAARAESHPRHATALRERVFDYCLRFLEGDGSAAAFPGRKVPPREAISRLLALDASSKDYAFGSGRLRRLVNFSLAPHDRSVVAALARIVAEEAERGDAVALRILEESSRALADTVWDLVDLLGMHGETYPLVAGGSLALRSRVYWKHFCAHLAEKTPFLKPVRAPWPPVVGNALVLLLQLDPQNASRTRARLKETVRAFYSPTDSSP